MNQPLIINAIIKPIYPMELQKSIYLNQEHLTSRVPQILYLFRDSQQSTLEDKDWLISVLNLKELIARVIRTDIRAIEIGGGRFFEVMLLKGRNPFYIMQKVSRAISTHDRRESPLEMQVLVRGRNGMGFDPIDETVQDALVEEHQKVGVGIFRNFHALNDINSIYISSKAKHVQGALAYTRDPHNIINPIFTDGYYISYANLLLRKGVQSLCIKDMAGQLEAESLNNIVTGIRALHPGIPITLHMHSTNEVQTRQTIEAAIELNIEGIELALPPLAGGASHLSMEDFVKHPKWGSKIQQLNSEGFTELSDFVQQLFSSLERVDTKVSERVRIKFSQFGIPGGAIPSVLSLLNNQFPEQFRSNDADAFDHFIDQYLAVLKQVREDAGRPPLVTPSADIVCRQAVFCLSKSRNVDNLNGMTVEEFYATLTPDYCRLILGHFGFVYRYGNDLDDSNAYQISRPNQSLLDFCADKQFDGQTYANYWTAGKGGTPLHPSTRKDLPTFATFIDRVNDFMLGFANRLETQNFSKSDAMFVAKSMMNRFATNEQLALMLAMKPKGKDDDFIWKHVLFSDFSNEQVDTNVPFDEDEIRQLIKSLSEANASVTAWESRSLDLMVFFTMTDKFLDEEQERLSKLVYQKKQLEELIATIDLTDEDTTHWQNKEPTRFNSDSKKLRLLKENLAQVEQNIKKYQESKNILNLKDNTLGLEFLNTYIYSAVKQLLTKIKIL